MIRHLEHAAIDKADWDARLGACPDRIWYALSDVLDAASPGWNALVDADDGSFMPLPWRSRWGVRYVYQPFLLQQLGPFGPVPSMARGEAFLRALPGAYRLLDLGLSASVMASPQAGTRIYQRTDQVLGLSPDAACLRAGYSTNHKRSLRKAEEAGVEVERGFDPDRVVAFLLGSEQFKRWGVDRRQQGTMERVFAVARAQGTARTYGAIHGGQPVAVGFFVRWGGRVIFLKGVTSDAGREVRAMHALIDAAIADHAGSGELFDLAGSNDPALSRFYGGFGAEGHRYLRALVDRTSPLIRYLRTWKHGGAAEQ